MDENIWNNTTGCRVIIDNWIDSNISYALILYPSGVLYLQWINVNKV